MCMAEKELTVSKIRELFEDELSALEGVDITNEADQLLEENFWIDEEDLLDKDTPFKRLNYLLDTKVKFSRDQLQEELDIKILRNQLPTFKLFVCNFYEYATLDKPIGFSSGNNATPPTKWNPHRATYSTIQGVIKKLTEAGLIEFTKGNWSPKKADRRLSRAKPSIDFYEWICNKMDTSEAKIFINASTHIRLRPERKKHILLDFEETTYSKYVDSIFKRYHKKLNEWAIHIDNEPLTNLHLFFDLTAVTNQKDERGQYLLRHGGRWYAQWNTLASATRLKRIKFNNVEDGNDLVEIDYPACGTTALYMWETGKIWTHYPYTWVGKWLHDFYEQSGSFKPPIIMKKYIKSCVTLGLNHGEKGFEKAFYAKHKPNKGAKKETISKWKLLADVALRVVHSYRFYNQAIAKWVLQGGVVGRRAMFIESNMVLGVLNQLMKENIPCITIYDSFIVPRKHQARVEELMYQKNNLAWLKRLLARDEQGQLIQP
jgi:hypothetical protein